MPSIGLWGRVMLSHVGTVGQGDVISCNGLW